MIKGSTFYPRFPEWLGKNSSQRKAKRLIRELKRVMGHHAQASRMEIQSEYVKLILAIIFKAIKGRHVEVALEFMDSMGLTNEHLKEHLLTLCMEKKTVEAFESLEPGVKAAFTREYNKQHPSITGKKGPAKKGRQPASGENEDDEEEVNETSALLDEEQI